jgi:hypothetical protein
MKHGDKTVKVVVYFFTDGLDGNDCWDSGSVNLKANESRDISPHPRGFTFNGTEEIPAAIARLMLWAGIETAR